MAGMLLLIFITLACGSGMPTQQVGTVSTIVASTIQALTAAAPLATQSLATQPGATQAAPAPKGKMVVFGNTSFTVPEGLGSGAKQEFTTEVELPYTNPSFGEMPSHYKYVIQDYQPAQGNLTPMILVFNADEFAAYSDLTKGMIAALRSSNGQSQTLPDGILSISSFKGGVKPLRLQDGYGWGCLTQIIEAQVPINNADLFFYFQGMTDDGKYYISAILPVNASFLAAGSNPTAPVPADGIPFPDTGTLDGTSYNNYLQSMANKLNAAAPDAFQPPLAQLDALIQSIGITK